LDLSIYVSGFVTYSEQKRNFEIQRFLVCVGSGI